jgi:quinol monooxygenase YgiN
MSTDLAAGGRRHRGRNANMSTNVVTRLHAKPGRGDDVESLLLEILGESLKHEGCEAIRITRDQDNPDHVVAFTLWTERHHYEDYLAWRTARGFTGTFEAMLTEPLVINYYDEVFYSPGVAASPSVPAAGA